MNLVDPRMRDLHNSQSISRELSWLSFNARVLQEAQDSQVPVIQRLRYLGIFSNNMDEFFRVRVAEVRRLASISASDTKQQYTQLLEAINEQVKESQKQFEITYQLLLKELRKRGIYLINEKQLDEGQAHFVRDYFSSTVLAELEPILLRDQRVIRNLTDESIYLAVDLRAGAGAGAESHYALVEVPTDRLPRFVQIPRRKGERGKVFIVLDNIIRFCMPQVFRGVFPIEESAAYTIKFSRDAELEIDTDMTESLIEKMESRLRKRRSAQAVRFVYDTAMPEQLLAFLSKHFNLGRYDSKIGGTRYHNSKDFMNFPNIGPKYLEYRPHAPIRIPRLDIAGSNMFDKIREKDVLLYFPYHTFDYIIDLLKTAALDPQVTHIKICLYRIAKNSRVCDALLNAVQNGKRVLAVVELQARFDEQANIGWAERLKEHGVELLFGVTGLKVHGKLLLIERNEAGHQRYYSHIGSGNFNERTSLSYTDFSLLTYDQDIGADAFNVFDFLRYNYKRYPYKQLLVSPHTARSGIESLIDQEISNAREGYAAQILFKCNNLVDYRIAEKLYQASQAGVMVNLIVRGMCSLLPGVKGLSENIKGISIVDRYLEHPRVYVFHNRGKPRYYMGSADMMVRNLDYRVEVLCPINDPDNQQQLQDILDQQWNDNVKARVLDAGQSNKFVVGRKNGKIRSQETIHRYLATGKLPRYPKSNIEPVTRRRKPKAGSNSGLG